MLRLILGFAGLLTFSTVKADDCRYEKDLGFSADGDSIERLIIDAGAGKLIVTGQVGLDQLSINARACASSEKILDKLAIDQRQKGSTLVLSTDDADSGWSFTGNRYARIDMEILVPAAMLVEIDDGSGSIDVSGVSGLVVDDGSGSLNIRGVTGDVRVDDGSGGIRIEAVSGTVTVDDGSGGIEIIGVEQGIYIKEDGSGEIDIANVVMDVEIEEDGSGDIRIRDVGGNVVVMDDASGGIQVKNVSGGFRVDRDSNGGIDYSNVDGRVELPPRFYKKRK